SGGTGRACGARTGRAISGSVSRVVIQGHNGVFNNYRAGISPQSTSVRIRVFDELSLNVEGREAWWSMQMRVFTVVAMCRADIKAGVVGDLPGIDLDVLDACRVAIRRIDEDRIRHGVAEARIGRTEL